MAVLFAVATSAGACAPVEIKNVESVDAPPVPAPHRVVVEDFAVPPGLVHPDRGLLARDTDAFDAESPEAAAGSEARRIAGALARHVVAEVRWLGWAADRAARRPAVTGDLRVAGTFVAVREGDSTERLLIGFGLGRSRVATHVEVFSVGAERPVLLQAFDVLGAGGHAPGLVASVPITPVSPIELADDVASAGLDVGDEEIDPEVEADVRRVAKGIGAQLSTLFLRHQWMPGGPAAADGM